MYKRYSKPTSKPVGMRQSIFFDRAIIGFSIIGILVSTYALYVEMAAENNPDYKAFCDFSERASCSRVLTSSFSKGFGVLPKSVPEMPNCIYGIAFYCLNIFLTTYHNTNVVRLQFFLALFSVASSVYLGYLLLFVLHDFCVVCVSTYVVNGFIAFLVNRKRTIYVLDDQKQH